MQALKFSEIKADINLSLGSITFRQKPVSDYSTITVSVKAREEKQYNPYGNKKLLLLVGDTSNKLIHFSRLRFVKSENEPLNLKIDIAAPAKEISCKAPAGFRNHFK